MKNIRWLLVLFFLTPILFAFADNTSPMVVSLKLTDYRQYLETNPPLDRFFVRDGIGFFLVSGSEISSLTHNLQIIQSFRLGKNHSSTQKLLDSINGYFHNYHECETFMRQLIQHHPQKAQMISLGQSIEGRQIYALKISHQVELDENEPNIYITGCHHAREWISVEVPLLFARYLLENCDTNSHINHLLTTCQIFIIPLVNPDGIEFSIHTYRWWRKNRSYNGNFAWGVDLNRNYGYAWGIDNKGSSPDPYSEVYRGPVSFSEPETAALREFMLAHPPSGLISYHNYSQTITYPWGYTSDPPADIDELQQLSESLSRQIEGVHGRIYTCGQAANAMYLTNGDTTDWVYGTFSVPAFTIELPPPTDLTGGFFTPEADILPIFQENIPALLYFIDTISHRKIPAANENKKDQPPKDERRRDHFK